MPASKWFPQQLVAFLEVVWSATTEAEAGRTAVERAAETLDAEIAAIVCPDRVVAVVGYPAGAVPVRELTPITAGGGHHELTVPGVGVCRMATVALDYPPGATFILARAGPDAGLRHDEASLLRGMARVTSTAMRTQHLLDDERAAREESDSQATENARLLRRSGGCWKSTSRPWSGTTRRTRSRLSARGPERAPPRRSRSATSCRSADVT
jgi:hypothetical protein